MDNQAFSKIWIVVILVVLIAGGLFAWQHWWMPKEEIAEIGPDAVWSIWSNTEAISELQKCPADLETFKHASACVVSIMEKYGASEKAIEFFEMTHYWFMTDFQEMGKVDLVQISTPWRANSNDQWALVNGSPEIVYVEDEASNSINYDYFVNTFPRYSLSSTGGFMKQDGQSFLFQFPIIDERGCRVCYSGYMAVVSFNFQDGNYVAPEILNFCTEEIFKAGIKDERFLTCD